MYLNSYLPDYLDSTSNLEVVSNKNSLIFGANGIGKSSIYKKIKEENNEFHFLDYDETISSFKKSKKNLVIAANLIRIEEIDKEIIDKEKEESIKSNFKNFLITTQRDCFPKLLSIFKDEKVNDFLIMSEDTFKKLSEIQKKLGADFYTIIKEYNKIYEIECLEYEISELKKDYQLKILQKAEKFLNEEDNVCPVCGADIKNLKEIIINKIGLLDVRREYIMKIFGNVNLTEEEVNTIVEEICSLQELDIVEYLVIGGDFANKDIINEKYTEITILKKEKENLLAERSSIYSKLIMYKENIENDIKNKFDDMEVIFDDEENIIRINLKRDVNTYSTGEVNYILFNIKLYEFFGSNKEKLIIDDILTSYDSVNQYSLVYLLVKMFGEFEDKKFICFTHNLNTIKIIHNQRTDICKKYILEKVNDKLYLFDFNYMNFKKLISFQENETFNSEYIKLLVERNSEDSKDDRHKIFHYDEEYEYSQLHNTYFVNIIEGFKTFQEPMNNNYNSFIELFEQKIELFLGIRIYIEKIIYDEVPEKREDIRGKTIGQKIDNIFPKKSNKEVKGLNREVLMSKKVMYNDSMHIENRINMPFEYIFNLKADDIKKEIMDIKNRIEKQ